MKSSIQPDPDYLKNLPQKKLLNLASVLKRITDSLLSQLQDLYDKHGKSFKVSWLSFLISIMEHPGSDVKDLAELRNVSSSAVSQVVKELIKEGYVIAKTFRETRSKALEITPKAKELLLSISPELKHLEKILAESLGKDQELFFELLTKLEKTIKEKPIALRLPKGITITSFEPCYAESFKTITKEWFEKDFQYADYDKAILENPKTEIIDKGGQIFFALDDKQVIGTIAIIKHSDSTLELAKLGVTKAYQGWGIAYNLIEACITFAKDQGYKELLALTNTKLKPAITLYKKHGFKETKQHESIKSKYQGRVDAIYSLSL